MLTRAEIARYDAALKERNQAREDGDGIWAENRQNVMNMLEEKATAEMSAAEVIEFSRWLWSNETELPNTTAGQAPGIYGHNVLEDRADDPAWKNYR